MTDLAQTKLKTERERTNNSVAIRSTASGDSGGRSPHLRRILHPRSAAGLIQAEDPKNQAANDNMGMSTTTLIYRRFHVPKTQ
ncbi:hypothetical protein D3C74_394550 [compost metagenome]